MTKSKTRTINLEDVTVRGVSLVGQSNPDLIVLDLEGDKFEVPTFLLRDSDIAALRSAALYDGVARITIEVDEA